MFDAVQYLHPSDYAMPPMVVAIESRQQATTSEPFFIERPIENSTLSNLEVGISLSEIPEEGEPGMQISFVPPATEWTNGMESKFTALVMRKAQGELSPQEVKKLDLLRIDRRRLTSRRPAAEVALAYRRLKATDQLLKALRDFTKVHG
jgi:hypothetical protein